MGFASGVGKSAAKMQKQVNDAVNNRATELFKTIISKTPIGLSDTKGQLINNWYVGYGKGKYNRSKGAAPNTSGMNSYNQVATIAKSYEFLGKDGEISFANSVNYAFRAEYAGWPAPKWSGKIGPYAMVRNSLTEIASKYKR